MEVAWSSKVKIEEVSSKATSDSWSDTMESNKVAGASGSSCHSD